ncbi:MAG: putative quinol monooxygenase [Friedmanniella sp.]
MTKAGGHHLLLQRADRGRAMVVEYLRYRIAPGGGAAFEAAYADAATVLASSPFCLDYELSRRTDEQTGAKPEPADEAEHYVLRIRWTSSEDHLAGFRRSPDFGRFFAAVRPYLSDLEEMRHYRETRVVGRGGADGQDRRTA